MNELFYTRDLNKKQAEAVLAPLDRPLKVTAGAGTGKTRMLTARYVRCLAENPGWTPEHLLALTFTEKAAAEMKNRITATCREHGLLRRGGPVPDPWIGTFHGICSRLARENALLAGLDPEFTVLTELESRVLFHRVVDDVLNLQVDTGEIDLYSFTRLPFTELPGKAGEIYKVVQELKDCFLGPEEFLQQAFAAQSSFTCRCRDLPEQLEQGKVNKNTRNSILKKLAGLEESNRLEEEWIYFIYLVYREYRDRLLQQGAADFADLVFTACRVLQEHEEIRESYRQQFRHIFVDEFQDTSWSQFELLRLLAAGENMPNVTVVGDEKQSIYTWRNARPENMAEFAAGAWGGREVILQENYRSRQGILDITHHAITRQEPFQSRAEEIRLEGAREDAGTGLPHAVVSRRDEETQAGVAAAEIQDLLESGCRPGDIAVLFRSLRHSKPFEDALRKRGIPYTVSGGTGFYQRVEIMDLLAYLKLASDPADRNNLLWVLMRPPVGLSDHQLYHLSNAWEQAEGGSRRLDVYEALSLELDEAVFGRESRVKLQRLRALLGGILARRGSLSAAGLLDYILEASGYLQYLYTRPGDEVMHSMDNLHKLRGLLAGLEGKQEVTGLDDIIRLLEIYQGDEEQEAGSTGENAVQLMTVHKSKGLEFKYVFAAGVTPGRFPFRPRSSSLAWHRELGLLVKGTVKYGDMFSSEAQVKALWPLGFINYKDIKLRESLEEDRRVLYVALSRAEDGLYVLSGEPPERVPAYLQDYYGELAAAIWEGSLDSSRCTFWIREEDTPAGCGFTQAGEDWKLENILSRPGEEKEPAREETVSLSFTGLARYRECPARYYYQYVLRVPEDGPAGRVYTGGGEFVFDAGILGSIVHNAVQSYELAGAPGGAEELVQREAALLGIEGEEYRERYRDTAVTAFNHYLQLASASAAEKVYTEQEFHARFSVAEGGLEFNGFADRLEINGSRARVIDFKTNLDLAPEKIELYSFQLNLYACGLQKVFPGLEQFSLEIWHLNTGKVITVESRTGDAEKELLAAASALLRGEYTAQIGEHCRYCSYGFLCPGGHGEGQH